MCGIVAHIGEHAQNTLFEMLKKLEYRGYDSSGIATIFENKFDIIKTEGDVEHLKQMLTDRNSGIGIGHTRWATHGEPSIINAHPHLSPNGRWAIVHNGIIENFCELKHALTNEGYSFSSDTDTEIVAALFERYESLPKIQQIQKVVSKLVGSFSCALIDKINPDSLILIKKKSPLFVAKLDEKIYAASDPIALLGKDYYIFEDNEFCIANKDELQFFNFRGERILKRTVSNTTKLDQSSKTLPHHMLEEIHESPLALKRLCNAFLTRDYIEKIKKIKSFDFNKIYIVGCGTAYHSGLIGAKYFQNRLGISASAHIASEFKYNPPILDRNTLCIFVSQSGETADTIASLLEIKKRHLKTVAITNAPHSTISRLANIAFSLEAGAEIAVASTKAYANQCAAFFLLSKALAKDDVEGSIKAATKQIVALSRTMSKLLSSSMPKDIELLSDKVKDAKNVFFIGKNFDHITACEASLKLKEITYINCSALPAGELKHGPLALIEEGVFVVAISTQKRLASKTQNALDETLSRGASTLLVSTLNSAQNNIISLPRVSCELAPILSIMPFWIMSYFVSTKKGINPDRPRNLAKSVTVE